MKIAVFHNYLDNIGGSEIVALTLARELNADLYTTNIDHEKIKKMGFESVIPRINSIGRIPINAPLRQQVALLRFRRLNLKNKYDFYIISGDWAVSGAINNKPNLWYVHSPLNELWTFKDYIKENILSLWQRPLFEIWVFFNKRLTQNYSENVEIWVCNSINTRNRIKKYYNKEAVIINPPIETKKFHCQNPLANGFWLSVNRLSATKRIDIQLKAFQMLPEEKLVIIGSYEKGSSHFEKERKYLESISPKNIEIKSWVSQDELTRLYAGCKGFITTSKDEDFGMNVVEAMASGKAVIAPNEGGYKETIINGKTGILIDDINENKLAEAIKKISDELKKYPDKYKIICRKQAEKFDTAVFIKNIKEQIER